KIGNSLIDLRGVFGYTESLDGDEVMIALIAEGIVQCCAWILGQIFLRTSKLCQNVFYITFYGISQVLFFILTLGHGDVKIDRDKDRKSTRLNSSHVKNSYAVF